MEGVHNAIERGQSFLSRTQAPDGHWGGELEADATITSEYLLLMRLLDREDPERDAKAVRYLRSRQLPDGGWPLYPGGAANLSVTIKAYFAMKLCAVSPDDPAMQRAREHIRARGGPPEANVFTKISLALFGEYDWSAVPTMPAEIMLLPRWSYFNIYEVSYWSRTVIVPLLILLDRQPVKRLPAWCSLDELWPGGRDPKRMKLRRDPMPITWKNVFLTIDQGLKLWERWGPRPLRERAIDSARQWMEERVAVPGGLGGIYPAMANAVLAMRALGYPDDHPLIQGQLKEIEALAIEDHETLHYQPCVSPVWDTALAANALLASGLPGNDLALIRAAEWLLDEQILAPGDWQVKRPGIAPGGWPFQYANDFYPDLDDTAMAIMAINQIALPHEARKTQAISRGLHWFLGMQGRDGGWGSFDADNNHLFLNNIPFADHGALLDPSTEDLTGRGLELLGALGYTKGVEPARRAIEFLKRSQTPAGCWFGRWGVNYIYGTWSVLRGLRATGEDLQAEHVQRALRWLMAKQNPDGGWGETCDSYQDPSLAGTGFSTPSQTAWALLGLFAGGVTDGSAVERGIQFLVDHQDANGAWEDPYWNGTGFPRVFYLKYHLYAKYFPLWALGVYRQARG
ncbi:MAG TPA: squalene--hopene cyclase [Methylomirabilota bacterium]|nr:squalene--hopene cyclase [Methylomirabilota bacterium]